MAYTKTTWVNNTAPALAAVNLNHAEQGISDATDIAIAAAAAAAAAGGAAVNVVNATANYTAAANNLVLANAASGPFTVTIPHTANAETAVMKTDTTANLVTVVVAGGTVNGDPSALLESQWACGIFVGTGTNAVVVATNGAMTSGTGGGGGSGAVNSVDNADTTIVVTGTASDVLLAVHTGNTTGTVAAGDDPRFAGARPPTAHASTHAVAGTDPVALAGSQITSGTVAQARLGTGTPSGSNFLRGDGTWAVPPGGGGGGGGTAAGTSFDPTGTGWTSTDLQALGVEADAVRASDSAATVATARSGMVLATSLLPIHTTGGRPASGVGAPFYWDSTLVKLGCWDGSVWRDAMGVAI